MVFKIRIWAGPMNQTDAARLKLPGSRGGARLRAAPAAHQASYFASASATAPATAMTAPMVERREGRSCSSQRANGITTSGESATMGSTTADGVVLSAHW